jgi:uncharacterized lipoprotein YmbA
MNTQRIFLLATSLLAASLVTGCLRLKPQPDPVRFYVLSSAPEAVPVDAEPGGRPLFVGRVEVPDYLGNPGIALRWTESRVDFSSIHQWAEPVRDGATRVLRDALGRRLGPDRLHAAAIRRPAGPHLDLQVTLLQFECYANREAVLRARWQVMREPERQRLAGEETVSRREVTPAAGDYTPAVLALSGCLEDLASVIAARLHEAERP